MRKKQVKYNISTDEKGICTIEISEIRYHKNYFGIVEKIVKSLFFNCDLFLSLYRLDGINLSEDMRVKYEAAIPAFFNEKGSIKKQNQYLTSAKFKLDDNTYDIIPIVFDYYLETVICSPHLTWDDWKKYNLNYINQRSDEIVAKGYSDLVLTFFDSGSLSISVNPLKHCVEDVVSMIEHVMSDTSCQ